MHSRSREGTEINTVLERHTMLYFIQCKVSIQVRGISGPFVQTITKLVNAKSTPEAKSRYEAHVRQMFAHMHGESFVFEYQTIADTI